MSGNTFVHFTIFSWKFWKYKPCVFAVFGVQSNNEYLLLLNIVQKKERKTFIYSNGHTIINHQKNKLTSPK